jgi:hypothetical protein
VLGRVSQAEAVLVWAATGNRLVAEVLAGIAATLLAPMRREQGGRLPEPRLTVLVWDHAGAVAYDGWSIAQWWADQWGGAVHAPTQAVNVLNSAGLRGEWRRFRHGAAHRPLGSRLPRWHWADRMQPGGEELIVAADNIAA